MAQRKMTRKASGHRSSEVVRLHRSQGIEPARDSTKPLKRKPRRNQPTGVSSGNALAQEKGRPLRRPAQKKGGGPTKTAYPKKRRRKRNP